MSENTGPLIFTIFAILVFCAYFYFKNKYSYFEIRGLKTPPTIWLFGNVHQMVQAEHHTAQYEWVQKYGKLFGLYLGMTPTVVIADPQLVKQVIIKDFHHFVNRIQVNATHELWDKNLFSANNEAWKRIRSITSPSFTSGKLRAMGSTMQTSIDKLNRYFNRLINSGSGVMDTKKVIAGFTIDVIASTGFATYTDTNADDSSVHPFVENGKKLLDISPVRGTASFMLPKWLLKLIGFESFFAPEPFNYFINLTRHIVEQRKVEQNVKRNDLVQMMLDASVDENDMDNYDKMTATDDGNQDQMFKKNLSFNKRLKLTDSEIIANCIFFFTSGFGTTAATISHCIFELATNQDIQDRLADDLSRALDPIESNYDDYFDTVMNGIPYLEAVIKETLRRYPPLSLLTRECDQDGYQLTSELKLFKHQIVQISVSGIHLNPEYYPEPTRFNPERFMPQNKHLLVPYSFLPFSLGPRNCVAMRFAYQEIKLCLAHVVRKFKFSTVPETPEKLIFKKAGPLLSSFPFLIKVSKRDTK